MTLVFDLGLNRPPVKAINRSIFEDAIRDDNATSPYKTILRGPRSVEDKRAVLGVFCLSSAASVFFRCRVDPLKYTPFMDDCLESLEKSADNPNDMQIVVSVRLQLIVEKLGQSPWHGKNDILGLAVPPMLYIKALQDNMKDFKKTYARQLEENVHLLMYYHDVELSLYEVSVNRGSPIFNRPGFERLELLYSCLEANKSFWAAFFTIPPIEYYNFSIPVWMQIIHALITLQLLSNFDHPDWNLAYVRETIDFFHILDRLLECFRMLKQAVGGLEGEMFERSAMKMRAVQEYIQARMSTDGTNGSAGLPSASENLHDADLGLDDFLNEAWLDDVWGPWDSATNSG